MEKLKFAAGWLLIVWGIFWIGATAGSIFFPQYFFQGEVLAILEETNVYMMENPSFLFESILTQMILPNCLPIIVGIVILKVPVQTIRRLRTSYKDKVASYRKAAEAKPELSMEIDREKNNPKFRMAQAGIAISCIFLAYAAFMDITVPVGYGSRRVVNLDLISTRQALLTIGAIALACAVAFLLFMKNQLSDGTVKGGAPSTQPLKECPQCAELIQVKAVKCRFCQHELPPLIGSGAID